MRFDRLDLNLLVALDTLLETKSVTESARRLHLSQPAMTGALNRLREFFEDDLLIQSGRRMLLSPKADELIGPVRRALMMIRAEITRPGRFEPATAQRRFVIAASDYAYTILIAELIARAGREAPGISFELVPPSTQAGERLERAELDLFITVAPFAAPQHPQLELWRDEEVVISWDGAGYPDHIDVDTFYGAGHAVALFGPDRQPSLTDAHLAQLGRDRRVELLLPSFSALPQAVVGTRRLATMHRLYAEHFAKLYSIRLHKAWQPLPDILEIAQWHQVRSKDPGLQWLVGLLQDSLASLPGHAFERS
jgi:LysR family transcriptional regulator, nod-box dependent transcriptional activator